MMTGVERSRGFTLFEVLVALSVAAIALTAAVKLVGFYVRNSAEIQERLYAHWAAGNVLVSAQLTTPWPDTGTDDGDIELAGREWRWRIAVTETPFAAVRRVEVQVFDDRDAEQYITRLSGYVGENSPW